MSPSQLSCYSRCPQQWKLKYLHDLEPKTRGGSERGKRLHEILHKYLTTGTVNGKVEDVRIFRKALELLPAPHSVQSEVPLWFEHEGVTWHGYADWVGEGVVGDLKTAGSDDPSRYAHTHDTLAEDLQAAVYAVAYFKSHPKATHLTTRWVYLPTRKGKPWAVETRWYRKSAELLLAQMSGEVGRLRAQKEFRRNSEACGAYGGCSLGEYCARPIAWHAQYMLDSLEEVLMNWDDLVNETSTKTSSKPAERKGKTSTDLVNSGVQTPRTEPAESVPAATPPALDLPKRKAPTKNTSILCIDCLPCFDVKLVRLDDLMIKAEQSGNLRASLKEQLQKGWQGALYVCSTTTWGKEALEVAPIYADQTYRGFVLGCQHEDRKREQGATPSSSAQS